MCECVHIVCVCVSVCVKQCMCTCLCVLVRVFVCVCEHDSGLGVVTGLELRLGLGFRSPFFCEFRTSRELCTHNSSQGQPSTRKLDHCFLCNVCVCVGGSDDRS